MKRFFGRGGGRAETPEALRKSGERENGGCPLVSASVATLGHVRGRDPMDTSSAEQDEVDIGRDGADAVGGTEPRPRGFPSRTTAARQPVAATESARRSAAKEPVNAKECQRRRG